MKRASEREGGRERERESERERRERAGLTGRRKTTRTMCG